MPRTLLLLGSVAGFGIREGGETVPVLTEDEKRSYSADVILVDMGGGLMHRGRYLGGVSDIETWNDRIWRGEAILNVPGK